MSLARRSDKYYVKTGLYTLGYALLLECLLIAELIFFDYGNDLRMDYIARSGISFFFMILILFNAMYSLYAANWTDSIVLSMGARRKDIFRGQILKTTVCLVLGAALALIAIYFTKQFELIGLLIMSIIGAFPLTALFYGIGHKIRKWGRVAVMIIAIIGGICGAAVSAGSILRQVFFPAFNLQISFAIYALVCVVAFVLLEMWVYKLSSKSMVR